MNHVQICARLLPCSVEMPPHMQYLHSLSAVQDSAGLPLSSTAPLCHSDMELGQLAETASFRESCGSPPLSLQDKRSLSLSSYISSAAGSCSNPHVVVLACLQEQLAQREKAARVSDYQRMTSAQDQCNLCFASPRRPRHLTISIGQGAYLLLPPRYASVKNLPHS